MAASKAKIATIRGTFLKPGVSKKGRLYTREAITKAVARMQETLGSAEAPPLTMLTHHDDTADVLNTVGRVTEVGQGEDGSAWFAAHVPDTTKGRDLAALLEHRYAGPVSLAGNWVGEVRQEMIDDGSTVETADDLDVRRIDFHAAVSGVDGAGVERFTLAENVPASDFVDEMEAELATVEADAKKPYGNVTYADPGYQKDGKKRYPLDTEAHVRAAWSYVNQESNASAYSASDLAKVKARIKAAMKRVGADVSDAEQLQLMEASGGNDSAVGRSATVQEHVEPPFLGATPVDPDQDGDVDGWVCPTCGNVRPNTDPASNPDGDSNQMGGEAHKETPVTEAAEPSAEAARPLTAADIPGIVEAVTKALKPAEEPAKSEPAAVTETAPTAEEIEKRIDEAADKKVREAIDGLRRERHGFPTRKGIVENKGDEVRKPLWEMSTEEFHIAERESANRMLPGVPVGSAAVAD